MKIHTFKNKHALDNTNCFECKSKLDAILQGDVCVIVNYHPYYFHSKCIRQILAAHIVDSLNREADIQEKFSRQQNADVLSSRLGYTHHDLALELEERRAIQQESEDSEKKGR